MVVIFQRELIIVVNIGCCPLSSSITPQLESNIPTLELSEHMIEFVVSIFFLAGIFIWEEYFFRAYDIL